MCVSQFHYPKLYRPHLFTFNLFSSFLASSEDCLDPMCSSHGICVKGECHCSTGWGGVNCETPLPICQEQCSGHGTFLLDTGMCSCDPKWTGSDCSTGTLKLPLSPPSSTPRSSQVFALRWYFSKSDLYAFMDHEGLPSIS